MSRNPLAVGVWGLVMSVVMGAAIAVMGGCAQTREEKLADKAEDVEHALIRERDRVLELDTGAERKARLDRLRELNLQLRAANISRAAAPMLLEGQDVELAYDVIEEVYGTINWNIPLGPDDAAAKPLPGRFGPLGLEFDSFASRRQPTTK